jgi:hypothetical protein
LDGAEKIPKFAQTNWHRWGFWSAFRHFGSHFAARFRMSKLVPDVFPGGEGGLCVRLTTLPPSCVVVMKSGNHNFL